MGLKGDNIGSYTLLQMNYDYNFTDFFSPSSRSVVFLCVNKTDGIFLNVGTTVLIFSYYTIFHSFVLITFLFIY